MKNYLCAALLVLPWAAPCLGSAEIFVVTSSGDSGPGSLREAASASDTTTGRDTISLAVSAPIALASSINLNDPVVIEGHGATLSGWGLVLAVGSTQSAISDLTITNSKDEAGLRIDSDCNLIQSCAFRGNLCGILIEGNGNTIGGNSALNEGNQLSGNIKGISIEGGSRNEILGNMIGLSAAPNACHGIYLHAASRNCIGKAGAGLGNVIGSNGVGWDLIGSAADYPAGLTLMQSHQNVIQNNCIGVNALGSPEPNYRGICVLGSHNNLIGGFRNDAFLQRNVISGNVDAGIFLELANGNTVSGNFIGLDENGDRAVPNLTGIFSHEGRNCIGGPNMDPGHLQGNAISGNSLCGISIECYESQVIGNLIGLSAQGSLALGNDIGIETNIYQNTTIGGADPSLRNVISGNARYGIWAIGGGGMERSIRGNYIGLNQSGSSVIGNGLAGICLNDPLYQVGGSGNGEGNLICGESMGIQVSMAASFFGTTITGNWIGVLADGTIAPQHLTHGIVLDQGAKNYFLGQAGASGGNLIAGCGVGIRIDGALTVQNRILSNTICAFGTAGIELANGGNQNQAAPVINSATVDAVSGTSAAGCAIEVFVAELRAGRGGSLRFAGAGMADNSGHWALAPTGLQAGDFVCALATDALENTSGFSMNALVGTASPSTPTPTSTPTCTPTQTIPFTATATLTPTSSATSFETPTLAGTSSATPTGTPTPTATRSETPTSTAVITSTLTMITTPPSFDLHGASLLLYPNPAKRRVNFAYCVSGSAQVVIDIYQIYGERVAHIAEQKESGVSRAMVTTWEAAGVAPGIYFCHIVIRDADGQVVLEKKQKVALLR